jgi:hypothetical protein
MSGKAPAAGSPGGQRDNDLTGGTSSSHGHQLRKRHSPNSSGGSVSCIKVCFMILI